jgi:hypothetical protein
MPRFITTILQAWAERRRARRRQANLRAGARGASDPRSRTALRLVPRGSAGTAERSGHRAVWIAIAVIGLVAGGGALIAGHARHLAAATANTPQAANSVRAANAYQSVLPGIAFSVPSQPGVSTSTHAGGALLVAAGMQAAPPVRVDLCSQMRSPTDTRLLPLRLGYRFDDVQRWVKRNQESNVQISLRNVLLVADRDTGADAVPEVQIEGTARADFSDPLSEPLQLSWHGTQAVRWISDAGFGQVEQGASGQVALRQQGWLVWGTASALRIERRANVMCPQAGELLVQMYRQAPPAADSQPLPALVIAFPARGRAVSAYLAPGAYQVPAAAPAALEDQSLFGDLQDQGLLRLTAAGAIEVAPRDLPQWQATGSADRVAELDDWKRVKPGAATQKLFKRLYYQADGVYVRQQIDIYNSERRLLAWRVKAPAGLAFDWSVSTGGGSAGSAPAMVATTIQMPVAASRLFAALPQGWQPWTRVARWPQAGEVQGARPLVHLSLALPRAAAGGEVLQLMLAGRLAGGITGASAQLAPACTGRACASPADVQQIALTLQAGTRNVRLDVQPLDFNTPEDQKYRHLRVVNGRLAWQALAPASGDAASGLPRLAAASPVQLEDRNGNLLWTDGAPTLSAIDAGLAPLLGIGSDHANSVSGMLARLPVSDCIGMRRGRWDGKGCSGGHAVPEGRQAGMVVLDTETGDILAAAGAGAGQVNAANWSEARDFDRIDPAAQPAAPAGLPARRRRRAQPRLDLQDRQRARAGTGGAPAIRASTPAGRDAAGRHQPPGGARGYAFRTDAPPIRSAGLARITNFRDQGLDRRAQDGRLGLAAGPDLQPEHLVRLDRRAVRPQPVRPRRGRRARPAAADAGRARTACARSSPWRAGSASSQALRLDGGLLPADYNWRPGMRCRPAPAASIRSTPATSCARWRSACACRPRRCRWRWPPPRSGEGRSSRRACCWRWTGARRSGCRAGRWMRLDRIRAGMKGVSMRHRGRRLPRRRAGRPAPRPVRQDRHRAGRRRRPGHGLVHRLAGAGQPARPDAGGWRSRYSSAARKRPAASMRRRWRRRCCALRKANGRQKQEIEG